MVKKLRFVFEKKFENLVFEWFENYGICNHYKKFIFIRYHEIYKPNIEIINH